MCYSNILKIEQYRNNIPKLYINYGVDTIMTNINIGQLKLSNIKIYNDLNKTFFLVNKDLCSDQVFLIDSTHAILKSSSYFNNKVIQK